MAADYDPLSAGRHPVGVRTFELRDSVRGRVLPVEIWYPAGEPAVASDAAVAGEEYRDAVAAPGDHPLVVFSHHSFGGRRSATFLCRHLASHGYVVAALDHSELVAAELGPRAGETPGARAERIDALIGTRVPDVQVLLRFLLGDTRGGLADIGMVRDRVGIVGHSFGGWTALAAPETEPLIAAAVALAPGGGRPPVSGVLPLTLSFDWHQPTPVLILTGDCDVPAPLDRVQDVFERAPAPRRMFVLRRADHEHFADDVEASHEAVRAMTLQGEAAWMPAAMLPASDLCPGEHGHVFARGLTVAHLDAVLRSDAAAEAFLADRAESALAARGVDAYENRAG